MADTRLQQAARRVLALWYKRELNAQYDETLVLCAMVMKELEQALELELETHNQIDTASQSDV